MESDEQCECCGETRGYKYTGSVYSRTTVDVLCPWCIADGSAAEMFDASFVASASDGTPPEPYRTDLLSRLRRRAIRARYLLRKSFTGKSHPARRSHSEVELYSRTPGFASFQEETWQLHCNEPCEFHGQALSADLRRMTEEGKQRLFANSSLDESEFQHLAQVEDGVELGYYFKFVCTKCGEVLILEDLD